MRDSKMAFLVPVGGMLLLAGLLVTVIFGAWTIDRVGYSLRLRGSERWPTVPGRITESDVVHEVHMMGGRGRPGGPRTDAHTWVPHLEYEYSVGGVRHTARATRLGLARGSSSTRYAGEDGERPSYPSPQGAEALVAQYPFGAQVTVHHHPADPDIACLEAGDPNPLEIFGIQLVFLGVGLVMVFLGWYLMTSNRETPLRLPVRAVS